jgi:dipeptidyl aminopeptidase/acylaminoacyl peptidase
MPTKLIPLELLFGNPEKVGPAISPDGRRLHYRAPVDGVMNVWVGELGSDDFKPVTHDTGRGIQGSAWAHDNQHVLYIQDRDGDENWHVYTVDLASGADVDRTPMDGAQAQIVGLSKRVPEQVLLGINADDRRFHDLYRLDLASGTLTKEIKNPGFDEWLVDLDLRARGGRRTRDDGAYEYLMGDGDPAGWEVVLVVDPEDATLNTSGFVGFDAAGEKMYFLTPTDANTTRLAVFDPATGERSVVYEHPTYDVANVVLHPDTRSPQLVFVTAERLECIVVDDAIAEEVAAIRAHDDGDFHLTGRDHADATWLLAFTRDDGPVRYYAWDRATRRLTFLFDHQPAFADYQLAKMEPFSFEARDGLTVHGYATFPPGRDTSGLPTVLYVHGGPWGARHSWGYDAHAQWLANRGYLCLEVNYRGSGGYGKDFLNASKGEWAGRMHDDLIDGCQWAIDRGYADADRIAIMGGSYGGYAALVGATFTPDFFKCAVDIVGPSNLITLLETTPPYWVGIRQVFYRLLGHPERDKDFLWSRSPLSRVDDIRIPILIAQGANDPRVKEAESAQIVEAMKAKGLKYSYLLFPDEGHGFVKPENRLTFYRAAEEFLTEHLV